MTCNEFKEPRNRNTTFYKDACLRCGKPEEMHKGIVIYYQEKILRFKDWIEARKAGFYPG